MVGVPSLETYKVRLDRALTDLSGSGMCLLMGARLDLMTSKEALSKLNYSITLVFGNRQLTLLKLGDTQGFFCLFACFWFGFWFCCLFFFFLFISFCNYGGFYSTQSHSCWHSQAEKSLLPKQLCIFPWHLKRHWGLKALTSSHLVQ